MTPELTKFIKENKKLMNENTKNSWKEIYKRLDHKITGEFTQILLNTGISDPAEILNYIPKYYLYDSKIQEYKIPKGVTTICDSAFSGSSLTNIEIPNSVTSIDDHAFYECASLTRVEIPDSVTSIGGHAFHYCSSLTSVVIGDGVTTIGGRAFCNCPNLTNVVIGKSVRKISLCAFALCDKIKQFQYKGTKEQAIELSMGERLSYIWGINDPPPFSKVICSDGIIEL